MIELKLENVELCSDVVGDDELVIRKGNATYIPSTPEFVEIARRCNNYDAITERNRLLQLENEQLAKDKAELVEALKVVAIQFDFDTNNEYEYLIIKEAKKLLEKHK